MKLVLAGIGLSLLTVVSGCTFSSDTTAEIKIVDTDTLNTSLTHTGGEALFAEKCGMCHRSGGMGTGILERRMDNELALLENRNDLQKVFIENVVRNGFITMFPISRAEVSDEQLDQIATYLEAR